MYNDKVFICKLEVVPLIPDSMVPVHFCQKNKPVVNFTTEVITYNFEAFSKNKMDALYPTEGI